MTQRPADSALVAAQARAIAGQPAVLATIVAAKGSTPRVSGTRMLVDAAGIVGSVGGGQLEFEIILRARELMAEMTSVSTRHHFILGPDLGQCCGGALDVVLEPITLPASTWLAQAIAWDRADLPWRSSLELGKPSAARMVSLGHDADLAPGSARLQKSDSGFTLFETSCSGWPHVYLFGAGHVGRALVNLLGELPYHVIWIDRRADMFPSHIQTNVTLDAGNDLVELIEAAPALAHFLVMTHSHALDFEIVQAVLGRGRFTSLGLIGSGTKRARFAQRLREAGVDEVSLGRLQCPIGLAGIKSKVPAAIAIAVVAELLLRPDTSMPVGQESVAGVQSGA